MRLNDFLKYSEDINKAAQHKKSNMPSELSEDDIKILMKVSRMREPQCTTFMLDAADIAKIESIMGQITEQLEDFVNQAVRYG